MRLTDASVAIHPRTPWEAIDLGVLLAQEHRSLLMASWAIVTLPIFALLSLVLWNYPSIAVLLFWWLKPVYERLPLLILSRALFDPAPSLKDSLKGWLKTLRPNLFSSLTWRRLSLSRSFILPVQQLEQLRGEELGQRIGVLSQKDQFAARCLTAVGGMLECCLWIGMVVLFYALIPQQVELDWSWLALLELNNELNWLEHLSNLFYALILIVWGPIYVSCGFTLYLNRRTVLEAWDIELVLRRLRQRLTGSAYVMLIGLGLTLISPAPPAWADQQDFSCPVPVVSTQNEASPDSPRLVNQDVTSAASKQDIENLLQHPPFKNPKTVSGWRLPEDQKASPSEKNTDKRNNVRDWLNSLLQLGSFLAQAFKVLLWGIVSALTGVIIWRYRKWLVAFVDRRAPHHKPQQRQPEQLSGLQVSAESLPDDIAGSAEQLWSDNPREALGLLYRGLLNRLLSDYQLPLKSADTEGQILQRVATLDQPDLDDFSRDVTRHWQNLAYGHQLPAPQVQQKLCDEWRRLFDRDKRS
jgi:hypothetical protein